MSDTQDYADLNGPLPDPGPRDGKHGEGDNWEYDENGQTATSADDGPARTGRRRRRIFSRNRRNSTTDGR
jgi:hypothetical protein